MPCALAARWQAAITGLTPLVLRDLARRLQELETVTKETNRQLRATLRLPTAKDAVSTEPALDHALASLERLDEIAESIMRRLDELDAWTVRIGVAEWARGLPDFLS